VRPQHVTEVIAPYEIYYGLMQDAKIRIRAIQRTSTEFEKNSEKWPMDIEFSYLQIRRVIENIVFSSLIKESDRYRTLRTTEGAQKTNDHGDAEKDWETERILKKLNSLSPHALPIPIKKPILQDNGTLHFDRKKISVNHARLIEIYKKCGGYMHSMNPLKADYRDAITKRHLKYENAHDEIKKELAFLKELLWTHVAVTLEWTDRSNPLSLDQANSAWIVDFGEESDNKIRITLSVSSSQT
jgi:hypothetical protein